MYTTQFAVAMLLATTSATKIADFSPQLLENENFRSAMVNSATYAYEIKDYETAGEIIKLSMQTHEVESKPTQSVPEIT
jgi:hypothetical protein